MLTKIYFRVWAAFLILAAILIVAGKFHGVTAVAFGFVSFGLIFSGMMFVLPFSISHPKPQKTTADKPKRILGSAIKNIKRQWSPADLSMRNAKHM